MVRSKIKFADLLSDKDKAITIAHYILDAKRFTQDNRDRWTNK